MNYTDISEMNIDFTPFETTYFGQKYYVQPETMFRHHFTNEPMIYIRLETTDYLGRGMAETKIITLDTLKNMRDENLVEEDD